MKYINLIGNVLVKTMRVLHLFVKFYIFYRLYKGLSRWGMEENIVWRIYEV
jgi:hypothetical protein